MFTVHIIYGRFKQSIEDASLEPINNLVIDTTLHPLLSPSKTSAFFKINVLIG